MFYTQSGTHYMLSVANWNGPYVSGPLRISDCISLMLVVWQNVNMSLSPNIIPCAVDKETLCAPVYGIQISIQWMKRWETGVTKASMKQKNKKP